MLNAQPDRRLVDGVDVSVLDRQVVTLANLHADAATHTFVIPGRTVCELYAAKADATMDDLAALVAQASDATVLAQTAAALVDAGAFLRHLAARAPGPTAARWRTLTGELASVAGGMLPAQDDRRLP
jgi:hypothetical protein